MQNDSEYSILIVKWSQGSHKPCWCAHIDAKKAWPMASNGCTAPYFWMQAWKWLIWKSIDLSGYLEWAQIMRGVRVLVPGSWSWRWPLLRCNTRNKSRFVASPVRFSRNTGSPNNKGVTLILFEDVVHHKIYLGLYYPSTVIVVVNYRSVIRIIQYSMNIYFILQ